MAFVTETADEEMAWFHNLTHMGTSGKQLNEHIRCVDFHIKNKNRAEVPVQQVAQFRRVFCAAYAETDGCFGLPRPTPKFIAIVNLSGYRAILYSEKPALVRLLCRCDQENNQRVLVNVAAVLAHACKSNCSVLCCYSLPWQAGVDNVHWEVRTLERSAEGRVRDGACAYSYTHENIRTVASTRESETSDPEQLQAQIVAMGKHFSAANVDAIVEAGGMPQDDHERFQKMQSIVVAVQADRNRLLGDIAAVKNECDEKLRVAYMVADERVGKVVDKSQTSMRVADKLNEELRAHVATLQEQNAFLEKQNATMTREQATQDLEFNSERAKLVAAAKLSEMSAKSATKELSAASKQTTREREQLVATHARQLEEIERRLQNKTLEARRLERALEESNRTTERLDALIEQMRTEKQVLCYETIGRRKKLLGLRCALAVASHKHALLKANTSRGMQGMVAGQHELQQMLEQAECALHKEEAHGRLLRNELDECTKQLDMERKKDAPSASLATKLDAKLDAKNVGCNTEPQQDPVELTELRILVAQLNTEKETAAQKEAALEAQVGEMQRHLQAVESQCYPLPPPPGVPLSPHQNGDTGVKQQVYNQVYNQVVVPSGHGVHWNGLVDLGGDPNGDAGVEALVGQVQFGMRALVDMARQSCGHKHAADNMWSELQAIKHLTGHQGINFYNDGGGQWGRPSPPARQQRRGREVR